MGRSRNFSHEARHGSFDELVRAELSTLSGTSGVHGITGVVRSKTGLPLYPRDYLRYGLYSAQLDALARAGYRTTTPTDAGGATGPGLLLLISEQVRHSSSREHARLWRFLGLLPANTSSRWDFRGHYYASVPLTAWAVRVLWSAYRDSNRRVYGALPDHAPVPEWESFYRSKGLPPT